jgi:sterol desaturase/sphingolipid hydroxylase (fatty acid hydroxylase superfamily)
MRIFETPVVILFLLLIMAEAVFSYFQERHQYKLKDTVATLCIAAFNIVMNILSLGLLLIITQKASSLAFLTLSSHWTIWVLAFVVSDFVHYAFHYMEHRSRFFWAFHSMHHSSSCFNLSVSLRGPVVNAFYRLFLQVPLCFLGFPVLMVFTVERIILVYGFFTHTEYIRKLGWLEYILNTPSHHRVHHGSNEQYLDKNFGTVLIIWDKIFNTFQAEQEPPSYGLTKPMKTFNPLNIIFHEWSDIVKDCRRAADLKTIFKLLVKAPGWKSSKESRQSAPRKY